MNGTFILGNLMCFHFYIANFKGLLLFNFFDLFVKKHEKVLITASPIGAQSFLMLCETKCSSVFIFIFVPECYM